jgi:hypothetical protein
LEPPPDDEGAEVAGAEEAVEEVEDSFDDVDELSLDDEPSLDDEAPSEALALLRLSVR